MLTITLKCLRKRNNLDLLCYLLSINVQFCIGCTYISVSRRNAVYMRKLENLTSTSFSIAVRVTDHLSVCMYTIPHDSQYCNGIEEYHILRKHAHVLYQGLYRRGQESLPYVQHSCMSVSYSLTYKFIINVNFT